MQSMRFFIALEIPEINQPELKRVQDEVAKLIPGLRMTDSDKLHLTLAFVGEEPLDLKESLVEVLNHAAKEIKPFELTPAYLDGFPRIHEFTTLWVGVKGDIDKLVIIRERIKDGLQALNIAVDERRFTPHIAIAKANFQKIDTTVEEKLQEMMSQQTFQPITVSSIKLFESIASEGTHQHNLLAEIKF